MNERPTDFLGRVAQRALGGRGTAPAVLQGLELFTEREAALPAAPESGPQADLREQSPEVPARRRFEAEPVTPTYPRVVSDTSIARNPGQPVGGRPRFEDQADRIAAATGSRPDSPVPSQPGEGAQRQLPQGDPSEYVERAGRSPDGTAERRRPPESKPAYRSVHLPPSTANLGVAHRKPERHPPAHGQPQAPGTAASAPVVRITIGRIEVRAAAEPARQSPGSGPPPTRPVMTLDEYLRDRTGGRR